MRSQSRHCPARGAAHLGGMADIRKLEDELNSMILQGQALEAFEKFYADDVVMQENLDDPRKGKHLCREYEKQFFGNIAEFQKGELHSSAVDGERSFSEWTFAARFKDGSSMDNTQVAVRTWKDGKIVHERFYYQPRISAA